MKVRGMKGDLRFTNRTLMLLVFLFTVLSAVCQKPRLLVTTDIGGDPDDQQSMIRLMVFSNEFEIEGFIASASGTPGELKEEVIKPYLIQEIVDAYGMVEINLKLHHPDFPSVAHLRSLIKNGNPQRGWENVGEGHDTEGSEWIIKCVDKADLRPLNIAIWGGQTDLAQALWKVKSTRSTDAYSAFISKIRIYDIADQDGIFRRIIENFPGLFYILNKAPEGKDRRNAVFRGMYLGGDESLTSMAWFREHVLEGHGPLGAKYPVKTWTDPNPHGLMKEGDTPSWFYFLKNGLNCPEHPGFGGWGGRFLKNEQGYFSDAMDSVNNERNARATVYRWREDFQSEFAARMDWCVNDFSNANHAPELAVNRHVLEEPMVIHAKPGRKIRLDASGSTDPDGDELQFEWLVYPEAGGCYNELHLGENGPKINFRMPELNPGVSVHLILRVTDSGNPKLTSYQRIILKNR
jgi:hypothetical protein